MEKFKLSGIETFAILVKWRKLIIANFILFSLIAAVISSLLPKWYSSTCSLLPPEQQSMGGLDLSSLLGEMPLNIPSLQGLAGPSDVYVAILRSRNVREGVIAELNLKPVFKCKTMEDALAALDGVTKVDKTEENIIIVRATTKDRILSRDIAQAFIKHLDRVNRASRFTSARYTREFIERRLQQSEADLQKAAQALRDFQKEQKLVSLEEQTKAAILAAANLEAELAVTEVNYNIARHNMAVDHPEVVQLALKLEELKKQVNKIELGAKLDTTRYWVPFKSLPDLGMRYAFLMRDVEVQKAIYKLLMQQYEQAKIQEARDTPTIQILDAPVVPEKKSKPKRAIITIVAAVLSLFVSVAYVFGWEYVHSLRHSNPEAYNRLTESVLAIRNDIPFRRRRK